MKLSELIATLQASLAEKGDTEEVALCFVVEGTPARRLDVFGAVTVLHDTAEYPRGMAYLVADYNVPPAKPPEVAPEIHDYPACALFRGGKCTCDADDTPRAE